MSGAFLRNAFNSDAFFTNDAVSVGSGRPPVASPTLPLSQRFIFGDGEELILALPRTPIDYASVVVGGDIESDSGRRTAFVVRRDELWTCALRFYEHEWPDVQAFLDFAQTGAPFTWYPDLFDTETFFDVQLEAPAVGGTYKVVTLPEYPIVQLVTITVVRAAEVPPPPPPPIIDIPARPWSFLRSRFNWFADLEKTAPITHDGDKAKIWGDYSGHGRDGITSYPSVIGFTPQIQGGRVAIRFGDPTYTNGDVIGATTRRGSYHLPLLSGFLEGEVMIVFKRASPPADNLTTNLFHLTGATNSSELMPDASSGHIVSTFGLQTPHGGFDCGAAPDLTSRYHLYHVKATNAIWKAVLNGDTLRSETSGYVLGFDDGVALLGEKRLAGGSGGVFDGYVKHLVLFNYDLSARQTSKWYSFLSGATSTLPY